MRRFASATVLLLAMGRAPEIAGQDAPRLLDLAKAHAHYSFAVTPGADPFRFEVEIDKTSTIVGVSVFRQSGVRPFQTLPACSSNLTMRLNEYDSRLELLRHADLNFDGFEDVELLQFYHPHLGKSIYCIYTWDKKTGRFRYAPEIPSIDPIAHPESKTITVHEDWQGGPWADRTYRWQGAKVEMIEENGLLSGSDNPKCGFTLFCSRLRNGKMVTTAERPATCADQPDGPLNCPAR